MKSLVFKLFDTLLNIELFNDIKPSYVKAIKKWSLLLIFSALFMIFDTVNGFLTNYHLSMLFYFINASIMFMLCCVVIRNIIQHKKDLSIIEKARAISVSNAYNILSIFERIRYPVVDKLDKIIHVVKEIQKKEAKVKEVK